MDKEKFIGWLELTYSELDALASISGDNDSIYYTGQLCMVKELLNRIESGYFDMQN